MKTGEKIHEILRGLAPCHDPDGFLACPLHLAASARNLSGLRGNPDAELAAHLLGWPRIICAAIADAFDGDGLWPDNLDARTQRYHKRFALAKNAGRRECLEFDETGSTF